MFYPIWSELPFLHTHTRDKWFYVRESLWYVTLKTSISHQKLVQKQQQQHDWLYYNIHLRKLTPTVSHLLLCLKKETRLHELMSFFMFQSILFLFFCIYLHILFECFVNKIPLIFFRLVFPVWIEWCEWRNKDSMLLC